MILHCRPFPQGRWAIRDAVSEVLTDGSYRAAAEDIAAELRSQPVTDEALEALESA